MGNRPLERIGFTLMYQDDSLLLFGRGEERIVIEMLAEDLEPSIGFAIAIDNNKYDEFVYTATPYTIIGVAMEEAAYFASYVCHIRSI